MAMTYLHVLAEKWLWNSPLLWRRYKTWLWYSPLLRRRYNHVFQVSTPSWALARVWNKLTAVVQSLATTQVPSATDFGRTKALRHVMWPLCYHRVPDLLLRVSRLLS